MLVDGLSIDLTRQGLSRSTILFLLSKNALTDARDGARMPSPDLFACDGVMARSIVKQRDRYVRTYQVPGIGVIHTHATAQQQAAETVVEAAVVIYIYVIRGAQSVNQGIIYWRSRLYLYASQWANNNNTEEEEEELYAFLDDDRKKKMLHPLLTATRD